MKTTFILAGNFGVTPFEIMRQDLDEVILIINYLSERGRSSKGDNNTNGIINEKEQDKEFWSAF
jgi:hypothetical protein